MQTYQIALYPGDGIGPEVLDESVRVLDAVQAKHGFRLQYERLPWGYDYWTKHGTVVPENFLDVVRPKDAILLGAVGWPEKIPDHVTLAPLVKIRQTFDQYACVRPARLPRGVPSVLAQKGSKEIDLVVIRENSEGEYIDSGSRFHIGRESEFALQTAIHTRKGVERILRFGYDLARRRRKKLTMITKSNAMKYSYVMWDEILEELRGNYPDVETDKQHCDSAAMDFVRRPERYDVVVASNLFGDLLTDLGGIIGGGLGLAPSTNTNPERKFPSMFEPVHGSAPDIAGRGIANPVAMILSAAMMLDWLGPTPETTAAAEAIRRAVDQALADGAATTDLGGKLTTKQMGDAVLKALG